MIFDKIADFIMKHAKVILALWVVILVCAVPFALKASDTMQYDLNSMASDQSESIQGLVQIGTVFPTSNADASSTPILVVKYDNQAGHDQVAPLVNNINAKIQSDPKLSEKFVQAMTISETEYTGGTSITLVAIMYDVSGEWSDTNKVIEDTPNVRALINDAKSQISDCQIETYLTGSPAITYDMKDGALSDIQRIDPFTILLILILVGLFFRSIISSATPPITIGVAFVVVMALIFGIGTALNVFFVTEMMLLVSMMGAGCDYCIFIIARYREELRDGKPHQEALHEAIKWAGESITTSACSVIIGFGAMCICSYSMVSTMGLCLAVGIIIALLAALTLIPSILMLVGDRIFWPTKIKEYEEGGKATKGWYNWFAKIGARYFEASSKFSIKHAGAIVVAAIIVTVPAAYMTFTNETSYDMIGSMQTGDSGTGMDLMGQYANQGMLMPDYAVIEYNEPIAYVTLTEMAGQTVGAITWNTSFNFTKLDNLKTNIQGIDDNVASVTTYFKWDDAKSNEAVQKIVDEKLKEIQEEGKDPTQYNNTVTLEAIVTVEKSNGGSTSSIAIQTVIDSFSPILTETVKPIVIENVTQNIMVQTGLSREKAYPIAVETVEKNPQLVTNAVNGVFVDTLGPVFDYAVNCGTANFGGAYAHPEKSQESDLSGASKATEKASVDALKQMLAQFGVKTDDVKTYDAEYIKVTMATKDSAMSPTSMKTIDGFQNAINKYRSDDTNVENKWVTGTAVVMYDVSKVISGEFKLIAVLVIVLILALLFFVMKSYITPIRSVATILMSIAWTIALTHIVFVTWLHGEMTWLVPLILLVICLGLGMDYDILLTTRIKENISKGMSNDEAIHHAVTHTGSVITICGLIMGGAFGTLMLSSMEMLQEFGFALCFAILVDALIVRTYIVPAIMHLLGKWNWIGPKFLHGKKTEE